MIATLERQINIKDFSLGDPKVPARIRPDINFVGGFRAARQLFEQVPSLPASLADAVCSFTGAGKDVAVVHSFDRAANERERGWKDRMEKFLDSNIKIKEAAGLSLLIFHTVFDARNEMRDLKAAEARKISNTFLMLAQSDHWAEHAENFRIAARYPDVMAVLYEAIAYQESTLSIPYYSTLGFKSNESENIPVMRRF